MKKLKLSKSTTKKRCSKSMTPSARLYTPPVFASKEPKISTDCYCVLDCDNHEIVVSKSMKSVRELASITKTMTLYTTLNLLEKYNLSIDSTIVVTEKSAKISGNSAHLKTDDILTIRDICYALSHREESNLESTKRKRRRIPLSMVFRQNHQEQRSFRPR